MATEPRTHAGRTMLQWLTHLHKRTGWVGIPGAEAIIRIESEAATPELDEALLHEAIRRYVEDDIAGVIAAEYARLIQAGDADAEAAMRRMVERAQASGTYDEYRPTATREHGDAVEAEREEQGR